MNQESEIRCETCDRRLELDSAQLTDIYYFLVFLGISNPGRFFCIYCENPIYVCTHDVAS
jgi:uncharacterized Zn-finger protein